MDKEVIFISKNLIDISLKNYDKVLSDIKKIKSSSEKALKNTVNDMRARTPTPVAKSITKFYNVKYKEISRGKKGEKEKHIGSLRIRGGTIYSIELKYSGLKLVPSAMRFSLKGGERPIISENGKKKKTSPLTMTVTRGTKEKLPTNAFLAESQFTEGRKIPFQRVGTGRGPLQSVTTVSLPEMVEDKNVSSQYMPQIQTILKERLQHNINRQFRIKK